MTEVDIACSSCQAISHIEFDFDDLVNYQNGQMVQDAFPYLTAAERELAFMTGICENCFDAIWGE